MLRVTESLRGDTEMGWGWELRAAVGRGGDTEGVRCPWDVGGGGGISGTLRGH